jgi:two-component system sensor histidine kinase CpxA
MSKRVVLVRHENVALAGLPELVRSAIENIVRNATRHTRPGTSVEVGLKVGPSTIAQVWVRDHGPGIDDVLVDEMFKPFWRNLGDEDGPTAGAGLDRYTVSNANSVLILYS